MYIYTVSKWCLLNLIFAMLINKLLTSYGTQTDPSSRLYPEPASSLLFTMPRSHSLWKQAGSPKPSNKQNTGYPFSIQPYAFRI
jgi:hypothetical protein